MHDWLNEPIEVFPARLAEEVEALAILCDPLVEIAVEVVGVGLLKRGCRR
jgi:hypothetical protein